MKKFLVIILAGISLVSCTKKVSAPGAADQNAFFQDANVNVETMKAVPTASNTITINFSTAFENNISRIELMSSATASTFCTTQAFDISGNSSVKKDYSFTDAKLKGSTMYYLLRFKDSNGNWTYSPYLTVKVN
ncbi:MAG: hypothetical protein ABI405_00280 [Parafilimonas sp.]